MVTTEMVREEEGIIEKFEKNQKSMRMTNNHHDGIGHAWGK